MSHLEILDSVLERLEFEIQCCNHIRHGKDWVEHESKTLYDVWLLTDGEIKIEIDAKEYLLEQGDLFLHYPQKMYLSRCVSQDCSFIFVQFKLSLGNNQRPLWGLGLGGKTDAEAIEDEKALFIKYFKRYKESLPLSSLALKGSLIMLISKIAAIKAENKDPSPSGEMKSPYIRIEKVLSYITQNIDKPLKIRELANYMCVSEKYFIYFFKRTFGFTPHEYITRIKLKRAFEYLSEEKYSVKETGQMLGYSDQYTFSKAFKKFYGFSPSEVYKCMISILD